MYKDYMAYQNRNLCGLVFEQAWLKGGIKKTDTEAQDAGWWFEDMVVRGKSDKQPTLLKAGTFNALFRTLEAHIPLAKEMLANEGKLVSSDETNYRGNVRVKRDLVFLKDNKIKVVDIKTTAHLNNKWDYYAWGALKEGDIYSHRFMMQKHHHSVQAKTYMSVPYNDIMPDSFEYWIFSSKDNEILILDFTVEEIEAWYEHMEDTLQQILDTSFFEPMPELKRCNDCPLNKNCKYRSKLPNKIKI